LPDPKDKLPGKAMAGILQVLLCDRHHCHWPGLATLSAIVDFHHLAIYHARHTTQKKTGMLSIAGEFVNICINYYYL
jgi:hypothetical protein